MEYVRVSGSTHEIIPTLFYNPSVVYVGNTHDWSIDNLATIGALLDLFGADFGVWVRLKKKLGPTYANNQLWFLKYSPIFF